MFPWALAAKALTAVARRQGRGVDLLYWCTETFRNAHDNWNYDSETNGEFQLLRRLKHLPLKTIFDVGANLGEWSKEATDCFPTAAVHAFEIVPATYEGLTAQIAGMGSVRCHDVGLSDRDGGATLNYTPENDQVASLFGVDRIHALPFVQLDVAVRRGDTFCAEAGIDAIDILKIDAEGAEHLVLDGFGAMLDDGRIGLIQFEYGMVNIFTHKLLVDYWPMLESRHYRIGKLMPQGVTFGDYSPRAEDFRGANYIAVHRSRQDMAELVAKR
jgi:FkbM family methyltransferase